MAIGPPFDEFPAKLKRFLKNKYPTRESKSGGAGRVFEVSTVEVLGRVTVSRWISDHMTAGQFSLRNDNSSSCSHFLL